MIPVDYLSTSSYPALRDMAVNGNAELGCELLTRLLVGQSYPQVKPLVTRILAVNDSFVLLAMPIAETTAQRKQALDYLLAHLPRPLQPRQVINTLVEYSHGGCEDGIAEAPTNGIVNDAENTFTFTPNPHYPAIVDYEIEIDYCELAPTPMNGIVDDVKNTFSFLTVPGVLDLSAYEYEITT